MSDERLGEELKRYGLEGMGGDPVDVLLRHIYANHEAALGAKDGTIASLESQNQALQEERDTYRDMWLTDHKAFEDERTISLALQERAEKAEARAIEMERLKDAQKNKRRVAQRASASQGPAIERLKAQNQALQEHKDRAERALQPALREIAALQERAEKAERELNSAEAYEERWAKHNATVTEARSIIAALLPFAEDAADQEWTPMLERARTFLSPTQETDPE